MWLADTLQLVRSKQNVAFALGTVLLYWPLYWPLSLFVRPFMCGCLLLHRLPVNAGALLLYDLGFPALLFSVGYDGAWTLLTTAF